MEIVNQHIQMAVEAGKWLGIQLSRQGPLVSHLYFADDLLLFRVAFDKQASGMKQTLQNFCSFSGQRINMEKS